MDDLIGPAKNKRSHRKNTGTVNPKCSNTPKKMAETKTIIPVHKRICIKNKKTGKAARASTRKNRALRAESRQCADGEKFSAIINPTHLQVRFEDVFLPLKLLSVF